MILVFGSVVRGDWSVFESDIDVLIVSDNAPSDPVERARLSIELRDFIGDPYASFEFHFATWSEYKGWYIRFIDTCEKIC